MQTKVTFQMQTEARPTRRRQEPRAGVEEDDDARGDSPAGEGEGVPRRSPICFCPGNMYTYVGECGSSRPSHVHHGVGIEDLSRLHGLPGLTLQGREVILTVPVRLERPVRERVAEIMFEAFDVQSCYFLTETVACAFATGYERLRVIDLGHSHLTAATVDNGSTVKYYSSQSLSMQAQLQKVGRGELLHSHSSPIASADSASTMVATLDLPTGGSGGAGGPPSTAPLSPFYSLPLPLPESQKVIRGMLGGQKSITSMLDRLPLGADKEGKILFTGGGVALPGALNLIREHFEGEDILAFDTPQLTPYLGASLLGHLDGCEEFFISKSEYLEEGKSCVNWRCAV